MIDVQIDDNIFSRTIIDCSPKSLSNLKSIELLRAIDRFPQGRGHIDTVRSFVDRQVDAEILQQNHDYAVLRINQIHWPNKPSHWLCGYSDVRGLFIHNLPFGAMDYCSEPMWYILSYVNRREDGFRRVQGDLLIRDIKEGWEIEELRELEKEFEGFFKKRNAPIGNRHIIEGYVTDVVANDNRTDEKVITKTEKKERVRIRHDEHRPVEKVSNKTEYNEIELQERGEEQPFGQGGD